MGRWAAEVGLLVLALPIVTVIVVLAVGLAVILAARDAACRVARW